VNNKIAKNIDSTKNPPIHTLTHTHTYATTPSPSFLHLPPPPHTFYTPKFKNTFSALPCVIKMYLLHSRIKGCK